MTYSYVDVSYDHFAALEIAALAVDGILAGTDCQAGRFCPEMAIQRWQFAVWMVRVLDGGEPALRESRFTDIEGRPWWESHVERLAELDVTQGCGSRPARFCPTDTVTRAQMAAFIDRAFDLADGGPAGFVDTAGVFSADSIDRLHHAGVSRGCSSAPLRFCPDLSLTRAQMAALLHRARPEVGDVPLVQDRLPDIEFSVNPPDTARIVASVYICAAPNAFTDDAVAREVAAFNSELSTFFARNSRGQSDLSFTHGGVISPPVSRTSAWSNESIAKWADQDGFQGPCYDHLIAAGVSEPFVILADVSMSGVGGYGWPDAWPAVESHVMVPTRSRWGAGYSVLMAHELGHAFYGLCHTFDGALICSRQGSDPDIKANCTRQGCGQREDLTELARSVMSYYDYGREARLSDSYVACSQRQWLRWTDNCDDAAPPDAPGAPFLTPGNRQVAVAWTAPADNGAPVTEYTVSTRPSGGNWTNWGPYSSTQATISGLTNGTRHDVRVQARNTHGTSNWSPTAAATPAGPPPATNPTLTVSRGGAGVAGSCRAGDGCEWVHGSGSGWTPGAQFWVKCGNFVDTSRNIPVNYRARYVDSNGNLSWGDGICVSNFSHSVEVWTNADGRFGRTIAAPQSRPPVVPSSSCTVTSLGTVSGSASRTGNWSSDCGSSQRGNDHYARQYRFVVGAEADVRIDLESSTDTYLYLLSSSGSLIEDDDDGGSGSNSRITRRLAAGTYVAEATTYDSDQTGSFTLRVRTTPRASAASPTLTVSRGGTGVAGSCTAGSGCRWVHGSGSGWTPGAQFWIKCGDFVDTSRNIPVNYRARYVDNNGNLSWGDGICLSNFSHSVEVWTSADGPVRTAIQAP